MCVYLKKDCSSFKFILCIQLQLYSHSYVSLIYFTGSLADVAIGTHDAVNDKMAGINQIMGHDWSY